MAKGKEQKRREAEERQAKYDALHINDKIARAVEGSKEHERLLAKKSRMIQGG